MLMAASLFSASPAAAAEPPVAAAVAVPAPAQVLAPVVEPAPAAPPASTEAPATTDAAPAAAVPAAPAGKASSKLAKVRALVAPATPSTAPKAPDNQAALPDLPMQPAPASAPAVAAAEADRIARFDAAIASVRNLTPSTDDALRIRDAVTAFTGNDYAKGRSLRDQITDPVGRKLVDWARLRSGLGDPAEYQAWLQSNPAWPDRTLFIQRLEEALFVNGGNPKTIKEYFKSEQPANGVGYAALASAHWADGEPLKAQALAQKAWRQLNIPSTLENGFLQRFGAMLTPADHKWRLDRLLMEDVRWSGDRNDKAAAIRRMIPLLPETERAKAEARFAVFMKAALAPQMLAALDAAPAAADAPPDWGLVYHKVQALRRANREDEASKLLLTVPTDPALLVSPDDWWTERRQNAYQAMKAGKARIAYDIVKSSAGLGPTALKDQAFFAGWMALRQFNEPKTAEVHFNALRLIADGPLSLAKADYWLGRTAEALGDKARADGHYKAAAKYTDTFFGQLASQRVAPGDQRLDAGPPKAPTADDIKSFNELDAVKAVVLARKSGIDQPLIRAFLIHLARHFRSESEIAMVTHLAEALGDTQIAVRIGKASIARGYNVMAYAYPVHAFPAFPILRVPPEPAFLLGIARQESEFNANTMSGAGARGLLQVMPITANHVCKDYKLKCDVPRLMTDTSYNAMMASAYIADRMSEFRGSYVLGIAGYNAGPGRARQWIAEFGDPRDPKVDVVDWIMRIPFEETREYVQKVLANIQVYRARLGESQTALRLNDDIIRARGMIRADALPTSLQFVTTDALPDDNAPLDGVRLGTVGPDGATPDVPAAAMPPAKPAPEVKVASVEAPAPATPAAQVTEPKVTTPALFIGSIAPIKRERAVVAGPPRVQPTAQPAAKPVVSRITTQSLPAAPLPIAPSPEAPMAMPVAAPVATPVPAAVPSAPVASLPVAVAPAAPPLPNAETAFR
jgi:soluble lytic murein transglycosylase